MRTAGEALTLIPLAICYIVLCRMPNFDDIRVFISYARKDGARLAQRLHRDLKTQGFDPWLDTGRIAGGAS